MQTLHQAFDIKVGTVKLEGDLDYCIKQLSGAVRSNRASNQGGYQGEPHPAKRYQYFWMEPLAEEIFRVVHQINPAAELHRIWFNINGPGHSNAWHKHSKEELVTVTYVKTNPDCGAIEFRLGEETFAYTPKPGEILMFNGALEHRVLTNQSDQDRISVACNFKIR